jgi:hypothetical protein
MPEPWRPEAIRRVIRDVGPTYSIVEILEMLMTFDFWSEGMDTELGRSYLLELCNKLIVASAHEAVALVLAKLPPEITRGVR